MVLLSFGALKDVCDDYSTSSVVAASIAIVGLIFQTLKYKMAKDKEIVLSIITILTLVLGYIGYITEYDPDSAMHYISRVGFIILATGISIMMYMRKVEITKTPFYVSTILTILISIGVQINEFYNDTLCLVVPATIVLTLGCILKDKVLRYIGYVLILLNMLCISAITGVIYAPIAIIALLPWLKRHYSTDELVTLIILLTVNITEQQINGNIDQCCVFLALGILSLVINTGLLNRYLKVEVNNVTRWTGLILNAIALYIGCLVVARYDQDMLIGTTIYGSSTVALILSILMLLGLTCLTIKDVYIQLDDDKVGGIYNCLKATLISYIIVNRLCDISVVTSVIGIILAIVFIFIGFRKDIKPCRLYGLALSLLCVIKLIKFDIKFESDIMRPTSFLIAGLLCFIISFIYSKLENKNKKDQQIDE